MKTMNNGFCIKSGPQQGLIDWMVAQHTTAYTAHWGLAEKFAGIVKEDLIGFLENHNPAESQIWTLMKDEQIFGSITLDNRKTKIHGARLRWFMLDPQTRGHGLGKTLLKTAIHFAQERDIDSIYLTTLQGLEPAGRLYRALGFTLEEKFQSNTWGQPLDEERLRLILK